MTGTTHRCVGCRRTLGEHRRWCRPCEARLPDDMARQVADTRAAHQRATDRAARWLTDHPVVTPRELQLLSMIAAGQTTMSASRTLGVTEDTARDTVARLRERWGCRSQAALVARAFQLGYLTVHTTPAATVGDIVPITRAGAA